MALEAVLRAICLVLDANYSAVNSGKIKGSGH